MNLLIGNALADGFRNQPDTAVVHHMKLIQDFLSGNICKIIGHQAVHVLLQRTDGLHQRALKIVADGHNLAGGLHLCGQGTFCADKFIKGQTGHLHDTVVQHRLKAGLGLSGNGVGNLVQGITQGNLSRYLGNGVARSLGSQRRGTADTGIYLDDAVFEALRMQGILNVAAAGDVQLADDIQGGCTQHLVLLVAQGLGRSYNDAVAGVYAYRVDIFHVTYGDAVAGAVPHNLILDLFPACNAALHQNLAHTGKPETVGQNLLQLTLVVGDSAAAATQGVSRTKNHRVSNFICERNTCLYVLYHLGSRHRLADFLHGALELQTVLGLLDGLGSSSDETYVVLL